MGDVPVYVVDAEPRGGLVAESEQPVLPEGINERRNRLRRLQDQQSYFLERIADSRVLIIEGISGSGKDTFQTYLKKKLESRDVHDYSEGELLLSWNQLQIRGIFGLRVRFMKLFVNYVKEVVSRDPNAVFLLNRFHLSTYIMTIIQHPKLEREYDQIINILRTLPLHIFILQLEENEIAKRSLHPERSATWQKFQYEIVKKDGFSSRVERYMWQQALILKAAEKQQLPYSVIKFNLAPKMEDARVGVAEGRSIRRNTAKAADAKVPGRKRRLPETVSEGS
jgi:thymidylate kinase